MNGLFEKCWKYGQKPSFYDRLFLTRKYRYDTLKRKYYKSIMGVICKYKKTGYFAGSLFSINNTRRGERIG